jgi:hypothetical protein
MKLLKKIKRIVRNSVFKNKLKKYKKINYELISTLEKLNAHLEKATQILKEYLKQKENDANDSVNTWNKYLTIKKEISYLQKYVDYLKILSQVKYMQALMYLTQMTQIEEIIEGLKIFKSLGDDSISGAEYGEIFGTEKTTSEEQTKKLKELGWYLDTEVNCWAKFV